jgi:sec-independent protein translocase protein TatA
VSVKADGGFHGLFEHLALVDRRRRTPGAVLLLVFGGRGKVSDLMGDVAKGIKSFKKGLADEDDTAETAPKTDAPMKTIDHQAAAADLKRRAESESKV